jgi:signal transduction histidine kinase
MKGNSLRLRLLAGAAIAIFLALTLAWAGISWLFHHHVERREAAELTKLAEQVVAGLTIDAAGKPVVDHPPPDPRFQPIAGGSYWQASSSAGSVQSQSLWDQSLPLVAAGTGDWSHATVRGPYGKQLTMVSRRVRPDARRIDVTVRVGSDDSEMRSALGEFDRVLALSLALLWLVLAIAAYVQVSLGLRPLDLLRRDLDRLRRSPSARLPDHHPHEIQPVIEAINAMASARETDLARARRRAADLAHSLKTPLAVVAAQSRRAREAGADGAAESIDRAVEAVGAALEAELARSRAAAARGSGGESAPLDIVEGLVAVVERTERGETIAFSVDIDPGLRAPVDATDLAEMLGALIENAARHARRQVRISGTCEGEQLVLRVEDDGPGMDEAAIEAATQRGVRIDETGSGHGFGLAIVRDLAEATEGDFRLERAVLGGLAAELRWSTAEAHPPKLR